MKSDVAEKTDRAKRLMDRAFWIQFFAPEDREQEARELYERMSRSYAWWSIQYEREFDHQHQYRLMTREQGYNVAHEHFNGRLNDKPMECQQE